MKEPLFSANPQALRKKITNIENLLHVDKTINSIINDDCDDYHDSDHKQ